MFCTKDTDKSPLSVLATTPGETYWLAAQVVLNAPWFMVEARQAHPTGDKDAVMHGSTAMFSRIEEVERMIAAHALGQLEIDAILVVTPGHLNGTRSWKMEPLQAVWIAEEPSVPGVPVAEIYETAEGVKYHRYGMASEKLSNPVLRFRWNG